MEQTASRPMKRFKDEPSAGKLNPTARLNDNGSPGWSPRAAKTHEKSQGAVHPGYSIGQPPDRLPCNGL
jgi:hypothetical protein